MSKLRYFVKFQGIFSKVLYGVFWLVCLIVMMMIIIQIIMLFVSDVLKNFTLLSNYWRCLVFQLITIHKIMNFFSKKDLGY